MRKSRQLEVANVTRGTVLGSEIRIANTALTRLVGLLGDSQLPPGHGLLIEPSSGVHTFGMRFPIDVVALDRHLCVRGVWENLGPFRIAAVGLKTHKVLELPVGAIRHSRTQVNDQLVLQEPGTIVAGLHPANGPRSAPEPADSINRTARSIEGEQP
jgi:uncharacterized membrane protein (UPF0127 family)